METLRELIKTESQELKNLNIADIHHFIDGLEEHKIPVNPNTPPKDKILKPFYYLRLIGNSIRNGENITDKLFVPKNVWTQDCKEISLIAKKCQMFKFLSESIQKYCILIQKNAIHITVKWEVIG
jgi:hypothetical protein